MAYLKCLSEYIPGYAEENHEEQYLRGPISVSNFKL
jgi:hypothetical protein